MKNLLVTTLSIFVLLLGCSDGEDAPCEVNPALCLADAALSEGGLANDLGVDRGVADGAVAPDQSTKPYLHEDIPVATLKAWLDSSKGMTLIDARELSEWNAGYIDGATLLPWTSGVLQKNLSKIDSSKPVVIYCRSGFRSNLAAVHLADQGFKPVYDVLGGFLAWQSGGYPVKTP